MWTAYPFKSVSTNAFNFQNEIDIKLNDKFKNKNIIPIIVSHGLTLSRNFYSTMCIELASHGYMVFAIDHHDGSCCYTENATGFQQWYFDPETPFMKEQDI